MGFEEAVRSAFNKYADFDGRARRSEYWHFVLFVFLISLAISMVARPLGGQRLVTVLNTLLTIAVFVPSLSLVFRRLHDTGRTGLWFLLGLFPLTAVALVVFLCLDSQPGTNQYGPNPKEIWQ